MTSATTLAPFPAARRSGVLALTLAVHLLALLLWTQERRPLPHRVPQVVSILVQIHADRATRAPAHMDLLPLPTRDRTDGPARPAALPPVTPASATPSDTPPDTPPDTHPGTAAAPAPSTADATTASPPAPANDPMTADTPAISNATPTAGKAATASPAAPAGGFEFGLAKRQAGRIDRELRKGKPGVPDEADTPWARFKRGTESAYIDRTLTWQSDTYTSPDGVVIYRFRQGNHVRCRRAGGVGMPQAGMPGTGSATLPGANSAMNVDCPKGVVWNQD
jgi:hypothetical protein